jgi:glycosyltransferase involved in cell wall biosynthesis
MRILYDHQMFNRQKYGGITKYFCELMKHFPEGNSYKLGLLASDNQHLKDDFNFFKKLYIPIPQKESKLRGHLKSKLYKLNNFYSRKLIASNNYDLLHPTYFDPYFLNFVQKPYVVTVHDLVVFKFQEVYKKEEQMTAMSHIIHNAKRIISISQNTKADIINVLNIKPEKIDVIYHGFNKIQWKRNINTYGRYILYVGGRGGYKNFGNLLKAFQLLTLQHKDLKLICVGSPFSNKEIEILKELKIDRNILVMGVNEMKLNELYSHALAFVYPTRYEGFGMPILEAFSNDCPVCLSNTSCLPEIAKDGGIYFDPLKPESIANAIAKTITDSGFSDRMIKAGRNRLLEFSWEKCAQQTQKTYERALS